MSVTQKIMEDMKAAMKARQTTKLSAIRLLLSEVKNAEIDHGELNEEGFQKVVAKLAKQIRESADEFAKAGREETAASESEKLKVIEAYLPAQLTDEELKSIIEAVKANSPEASMGQLMGEVMAKAKGRADGNRVKQLLA
jgi:uncharacterized protein YqeY